MKKGEIKTMPAYFNHYVGLVEDVDLIQALVSTGKTRFEKLTDQLILLDDKVYAPGKWTVKDIIQHIIDTERIFAYRALRFAREDQTPLPGYDENNYADSAEANRRPLHELLNEYYLVRETSILMFNSFNQLQLTREGTCNNSKCEVLALGFAIAGHTIHHLNIIKERYFPLLDS